MNTHQYSANIVWTGNNGTGTSDYASYSRDHVISIDHKQDLQGSSDSIFRGDVTKHNPEDMLLSSLSVCHTCFGIYIFVQMQELLLLLIQTMWKVFWSMERMEVNSLKLHCIRLFQ